MFSILQTTQLGQPPFSLSTDNKSSFGETHDFLSCLTARNVSSNTVRAYAYDLMAFYRFMSIAKVNIQNITTRHITQFLLFEQSSKISPRTINRRIVAIRSFLNSKSPDLGNKLFSSNIGSFYKGRRNRALLGPTRIASSASTKMLRMKVPSKITVPLSPDAIRFFIGQLKSFRDRAIVLLMLCSGLKKNARLENRSR